MLFNSARITHVISFVFGTSAELSGKIASGNWKVYEARISYSESSYDEGGKQDGKTVFVPCIASLSIVYFQNGAETNHKFDRSNEFIK